MRSLVTRMVLVVLTLLVSTCSPFLRGDTSVDVAPDAPADARVPRADVRRDAPRDVEDASPMLDPEWEVPSGVPADCTVQRATRPERLPGIAWEACGVGCSRANLGAVWNAVDAFVVDGQVWFEVLSDDFGFGDTDALVSADGPVLDAWRYSDSGATPACTMFWYDAGERRAGAFVTYIQDSDAWNMRDLFWTYDLATGPRYVAPDIVFEGPLVGRSYHTQEFAVSSDLVAFRLGGGTIVVSYEGMTREVFRATGDQGGFGVGVVGDHVTFLDAGLVRRLVHWTPERGTEDLYVPSDPIAYLRHDGTTLAWVRLMDFEGPLATRAELWTGELVRDPALFSPRLVNDRVEPEGELGGGMYGWTQNGPTGAMEVHLIDLDTGRHRVMPVPPEHGCRLLYVSREEVALSCHMAGVRSIYRYEPDLFATDAPPR